MILKANYLKRHLVLFNFLLLAFFANGQYTTQGKDFWLAFGGNYVDTDPTLQVRIVTTKPTLVTFTFTEPKNSISIFLEAGKVYTKDLAQKEREWVRSDQTGKTSKSLHIQTNEDVSIYAINLLEKTTEASIVLPVQALGVEYFHASYQGSMHDGYTLVAIEDDTRIYEAGKNIVSLNKGEVYSNYFMEERTGVKVTSDKPIAYFTTNKCTNIPNDYTACDCLYEQLIPVKFWGNKFLIPVTVTKKDIIRIIASQDKTMISLAGGKIRNPYGRNPLYLNAGEFLEVDIEQKEAGCYVETDKPVSVVSFITGISYSEYKLGDPALTWIPPIEQSVSQVTIAPFIASGTSILEDHYVLLTVPTKYRDQTNMSVGSYSGPLLGGTWTDNPSGYSYYSLKLMDSKSAYGFLNPYGITVLAYGLGFRESYYYLAGAAVRKLESSFYVNDLHSQDIHGQSLCGVDSIRVNAEIRYEMSLESAHLRWIIDGIEYPDLIDKIEWIKRPIAKGKHTVTMIVKDINNQADTVSTTFTFTESITADIENVRICSNEKALLSVKNPDPNTVYNWYAGVIPVHTGPDYHTPKLYEDTYYYVRTGCVNENSTIVKVEVINSVLSPDILPAYKLGVPYDVQLTSSAENPVFSYVGTLPNGLSFFESGLISGTVTSFSDIKNQSINVITTEKHGCSFEKEYTFSHCEHAPDITGNKLQYCQGELAEPLKAQSPEGLPLRWYAANKTNQLTEAPSPDTDVVGDQFYYVAQFNPSSNCEGELAEIKISIETPSTNFHSVANTICKGSSPTISFTGLSTSYQYDIYSNNSLEKCLYSLSEVESKDVILNATPDKSTSYFITVKDMNSCISKIPIEVKVEVKDPVLQTEKLPTYKHETSYNFQLLTNVTNPTYSYTGNLVTGLSLSSTGLISGMVPSSADYEKSIFTVTVRDEYGCSVVKQYEIRSCDPAPIVSSPNLFYCKNSVASSIPATALPGLTLKWYNHDHKEITTSVPSTLEAGTTNYYVSQVNPVLGCESEISKVEVTIHDLPALDFEATAKDICEKEQAIISLKNLRNDFKYTIYSSTSGSSKLGEISGNIEDEVFINISISSDTSYYLTATSPFGCKSDYMKVGVKVVHPEIKPDELPSPQMDLDYSQRFYSNVTSPVFTLFSGELPESLFLKEDGLLHGKITSSKYAEFTIMVEDINGCTATKDYIMTNTFIPKAFTPNGDGINDVFMKGRKVIIFDRKGVVVFEGNNGWDGFYKGKIAPMDIYFYKVEIENYSGKREIKTGYIGLEQ